ncbi:tubulin polyglutamylase TTLL7-like [Clavelina lepadiformis]|uniref:tubulin polyglutamylase TTLL7-like n=1 Tax=Clavelina lepadiformis TaxID=159417 RepID=UPI004041DD25
MKLHDGDHQFQPSERVKKKRRKSCITANTANCKYDLVRASIEANGMALLKEDSAESVSAYLHWHDSVVPFERFQALKEYQHINHFPSMGEICRKDLLARNMAKMKRARPDEFNFTPRTWNMPSEYNLLLLHAKDAKNAGKKASTFIQKPANGAMGNGIQLFRNAEKIQPSEHTIVQEYLDKPLLLDGYKMDLRLYVLITSCDPLRIFLYQDGLVRLSTEKYAKPSEHNVDQVYMHLTNYSVNKQNDKFERHSDFDRGSKRSIKSLLHHLKHAGYDTNTLWQNISDLVVKTVIVASPHLLHSYRMCRPGQSPHSASVCFEVLGFDIFLDKKLKPWLLEVNRAPSFGGDEKIDQDIKGGVLHDALNLINIRASDKRRNLAQQKSITQKRLFMHSKSRLTPDNLSATEQRKALVSQRKEQLKTKLAWLRKEAAREEFEDANMRGYKRIYPCHDKKHSERYSNLIATAFKMFQTQCAPLQRNEHYRPENEDMLIDLIEQCEIEEGLIPKSSKSLSSMPTLPPSRSGSSKHQQRSYFDTSSSSHSSSEDDEDEFLHLHKNISSARSRSRQDALKPSTNAIHRKSPRIQRKKSLEKKMDIEETLTSSSLAMYKLPLPETRLQTAPVRGSKTRNVRAPSAITAGVHRLHSPNKYLSRLVIPEPRPVKLLSQEREIERTEQTLLALQKTRIKFPGKSDVEADNTLDNIMKNWKYHKPRVASYWLVKLDSTKRQKVIDIVRNSVRIVMQKIWRSSNTDSLRLTRLFNRVFNRLHWSHGQGLWSCFTTSSNSWETILSKSTDTVTLVELNCCRRVVHLCKDCLLIVYQFANDVSDHVVKADVPGQLRPAHERYQTSQLYRRPLTEPTNPVERPGLKSFHNVPARFSRSSITTAKYHLLSSRP